MTFRYIDFVVTGTPRSGTSYMAAALRQLGYDCGHERAFDPWHMTLAEERLDEALWGDSSWLAVPYLSALPDRTTLIHVVRNPIDTINSIIGTGQLDWESDYRSLIARQLHNDADWFPECVAAEAEMFWNEWNGRIELSGRVNCRVRVEDGSSAISEVVKAIDPSGNAEIEFIRQAVSSVSKTTNTRPHLGDGSTVTLEALGSSTLERAHAYGYRL